MEFINSLMDNLFSTGMIPEGKVLEYDKNDIRRADLSEITKIFCRCCNDNDVSPLMPYLAEKVIFKGKIGRKIEFEKDNFGKSLSRLFAINNSDKEQPVRAVIKEGTSEVRLMKNPFPDDQDETLSYKLYVEDGQLSTLEIDIISVYHMGSTNDDIKPLVEKACKSLQDIYGDRAVVSINYDEDPDESQELAMIIDNHFINVYVAMSETDENNKLQFNIIDLNREIVENDGKFNNKGVCYYLYDAFGDPVLPGDNLMDSATMKPVNLDDMPAYKKFGEKYLDVSADTPEDISRLQHEAEQGSGEAMYRLAHHHFKGSGVKHDIIRGLRLVEQAAEAGCPDAMFFLTDNYVFVMYMPVDNEKAFSLSSRLAQMGDPRGMAIAGKCYIEGTGVKKNNKKAMELFKEAAAMGNSRGMAYLAIMYDRDKDYKDDKLHMEYLKKASENGDTLSTFKLAQYYIESGIDVEKGYSLIKKEAENGCDAAIEKYMQLCLVDMASGGDKKIYDVLKGLIDRGNLHAEEVLARHYIAGIGVERDYNKAFEMIKSLIDRGNSKAMALLPILYSKAEDDENMMHEILRMYERFADLGDTMSMLELGDAYRDGNGVEEDEEKAKYYYRKAAHYGEVTGMMETAYIAMENKDGRHNYEEAGTLFKQAALQGSRSAYVQLANIHYMMKDYDECKTLLSYIDEIDINDIDDPVSMNTLGEFYYEGKVIGRDYKKALELFERAIVLDCPKAIYNIGLCFKNGKGIEKDSARAAFCFEEAAKAGVPAAMREISKCYKNGRGVSKNPKSALYWDNMAKKHNA